jgi:hypothetical protein
MGGVENHALTLKIILYHEVLFFVKNPVFHTFLEFCPETSKIEVKFKNILLSIL